MFYKTIVMSIINKWAELSYAWNQLPRFMKTTRILISCIIILVGVGVTQGLSVIYKEGNEYLVSIFQLVGLVGIVSFFVTKKLTKMLYVNRIYITTTTILMSMLFMFDERMIVILCIVNGVYEVYLDMILSRAWNKLKYRYDISHATTIKQTANIITGLAILILTPLVSADTKYVMLYLSDIFDLLLMIVIIRVMVKYRSKISDKHWIDILI